MQQFYYRSAGARICNFIGIKERPRNSLVQERAYQLVIQYKMVSHESTHTSNIIQTYLGRHTYTHTHTHTPTNIEKEAMIHGYMREVIRRKVKKGKVRRGLGV